MPLQIVRDEVHLFSSGLSRWLFLLLVVFKMLWRESCAAALAHQNMQTVLLKDLEVPQVSCWRKANTESLVLVSGRTCQITVLSSEQPDNEGSVMGRTTLGPGVFSHTSCFLFKCYLNSELRWTCHSVSPEIFFFLFNLFTENKSHFAAVYYCMCVYVCDAWANIYSPIYPIDVFLCRFPILTNSMLLFYYSECLAFQVCLSPSSWIAALWNCAPFLVLV